LNGNNFGDYLYWNGIEWAIGDTNITLGGFAGADSQGTNAIAIGFKAGSNDQSDNAIAIGTNAGSTQGPFSIAIGYGSGYSPDDNQYIFPSNSICLNASGSNLAPISQYLPDGSGGFFVDPIKGVDLNETGDPALHHVMMYDLSNNEIIYNTNDALKTFVIDHPLDEKKYLVHACLEGPEGGVYYRGESSIVNGHSAVIDLPDYVDSISTDFTVQITPIYSPDVLLNRPLFTSRVVRGSFQVFGDNCQFFWTVIGKRASIVVEPNIHDVRVEGSGPYRWLS
jgi:hypothetical protein